MVKHNTLILLTENTQHSNNKKGEFSPFFICIYQKHLVPLRQYKNNNMKNKSRKPNGYWTKERCLEIAKKYSSKKEWSDNNRTSLVISHLNGWVNECTEHMKQLKNPSGYWTKERCLEEAKKYKTKKEWHDKTPSSYNAFLKNWK
jgi:hypothetical protein